MDIYLAPLKGLTNSEFRNTHEEIYGGITKYFTPFLRLEKGLLRKRDIRDLEKSTVETLVPQLLPKDAEEMNEMIKQIEPIYHGEININCGCPFPPVWHSGRGAGILSDKNRFKALIESLNDYKGFTFSLKMRIGTTSADEINSLTETINASNVTEVIIHPRIATDQYKKPLRMEAFKTFADECKKPIVYNGEINTREDCEKIAQDYPQIHKVMIGRGLLRNMNLANEINGIAETDNERERFITFHRKLMTLLQSTLCGDKQTLSHLLPYWEYFMPDMDKKKRKAIMKSKTMAEYTSAVRMAVER